MMSFSAAQIISWMHELYWPFVRIGALLMAAPLFGARFVPAQIRVILALGLTVVLLPYLPSMPDVPPLSLAGVLLIAQQLVIGAAIGVLIQMIFDAVVIAGQTIATSMGLGFAFMVDPQSGVSVPMLSQLYLIIATLLFLALDGHLLLIALVAESFVVLPVGSGIIDPWAIIDFATRMFTAAMLIALPAVVAILSVNISFGVMSRAAPTMNLFAVGFPVILFFGFVIVMFMLPALAPVFTALLAEATEATGAMLAGGR